MLQAVVSVHKTVLKENNIHVFIVLVLLYNLAKYQNRFTIKKIIVQKKRGVKFFETQCTLDPVRQLMELHCKLPL